MKKITIVLLMIIISIISVASPVLAATGGNIEYGTYGTDKPSESNVFNLSGGEKYYSYVDTEGSAIYTKTWFTGTSTIAVTIKNKRSDSVKVTLYKPGIEIFSKVASLTTPPGSEITTSTLNFTNLDKSQKYYLRFNGPCDCNLVVWGF